MPKKTTKPKPTLGSLIDELYQLRQDRLRLSGEVDTMKARETEIRESLLSRFTKVDLEGARGSLATVSIKRKTVARVPDWDAFYAHIKKTGDFELLQRRVNDGAFNERREAGKLPPGTEAFIIVDLSLNKIGSK